jgi:hypothetical protein
MVKNFFPGKNMIRIGNPDLESAACTLYGLWNFQPEAAASVTKSLFMRSMVKVFSPAPGQGVIIRYEFDPQANARVFRQNGPPVEIAVLEAVHPTEDLLTCCESHNDCLLKEFI